MRTNVDGKNRTAKMLLMLAIASAVGLPQIAHAETVLRIGMTAADIPRTLGQPDQGFEGNRFTGLTMYDALTMWDLSSADKASVMIPGLATEWAVDAADKTKWTFKLRSGVKFHDGSPFNADAVIWNVDKVLRQNRRPPGRRSPRTPRAPARGRCPNSRRASGSN
jgi:ABC-type transport system substrate-binding protein